MVLVIILMPLLVHIDHLLFHFVNNKGFIANLLMLYITYLKFWIFVCAEIRADIIMNQLSHKLKLLGEDTQMVIYLICGVPLLTNKCSLGWKHR